MGKQRGRLDPDEVKRAIAEEQAAKAKGAAKGTVDPSEPGGRFYNPFEAARAKLERVVPVAPPRGKASASERLRDRKTQKPGEPSELAKVRAAHKAARAALAEAVKPLRRPKPPTTTDSNE